MDLNGSIQPAKLGLKALDLGRSPKADLKGLDLGDRPAFDFKALDLTPRDGQPLQPAAELADLNARTAPAGASDLHKQAEVFVSQAFFGALLKQMRNSPFRSELFDGGRGGQAFGSLYDQHLAERMASGAGAKLVHQIVRKLEAKKAYEQELRNARFNARQNAQQQGRSRTNATAA